MKSHNNDIGGIPVARSINVAEFTPDPESTQLNFPPGSLEQPQIPWPLPKFPHLCHLSLPEGCYQLSFSNAQSSPKIIFRSYSLGSLRVEQNGSAYIISGDSYRFSFIDLLFGNIPSFAPNQIPIYPINRYKSYLKATSVSIPRWTFGDCKIKLALDEFDYTQPAAGNFNGTFPTSPSRTITLSLAPVAPPAGFSGPYFKGEVYVNGVLTSTSCTLAWASPNFRRATIEIHTMTGATAPTAVGVENFSTVYAHAKWDLTVKTDPNTLPVPAGVTPTACWSDVNLHNVMTSVVDFSSINLNTEWYMHVLVVPAAMGCGRGVMFDQINVPREGVASFSDDGYPTSDSTHFGAAANQLQRNVPRAFLRSCSHEVTHGFNQIHQEFEGGADNSIMTTSPGVANFLSSVGQTFPNDIFLGFNEHVRHHLIHFPDIVVRPGGMSFTAGHNGTAIPSSDEEQEMAEHPGLELVMIAKKARVKIGEPLNLSWELRNISSKNITVPGNISPDAEFAEVSVNDPLGNHVHMHPFVVRCDFGTFKELKPGESLKGQFTVFWTTDAFAFDKPGKHTVEVEVKWGKDGEVIGAKTEHEIFVDYPITQNDNEVIATLLNPEVGKFVALGGHAYHLKEAVKRISQVLRIAENHESSKVFRHLFSEKSAENYERLQKANAEKLAEVKGGGTKKKTEKLATHH